MHDNTIYESDPKKFVPPFIKIEEGNVRYCFHVMYDDKEKGEENMVCYIPAFDIYYQAKDQDEAVSRGSIMAKSFMKFWLHEEGMKAFVLQIHKMGFRAPEHAFIMKNLLKTHTPVRAKFMVKDLNIPKEFRSANIIEQQAEMAV